MVYLSRMLRIRNGNLLIMGATFSCLFACAVDNPESEQHQQGYFASECGGCVKRVCSDEIDRCRRDRDCAVYLGCLNRCPGGDSADGEGCEYACVRAGAGQASIAARNALLDCRQGNAGTACGACPMPPSPMAPKDPILTQQCRPQTITAPCEQCEWDNCCETWEACTDDCYDLQDCLLACLDLNDEMALRCQSECYAGPKAHEALKSYAPRSACIQARCASDCGAGDAGCARCLWETCADTFVACEKDPRCHLLERCIEGCAGPLDPRDCVYACYRAYPDAVAPFSRWMVCANTRCRDACAD